MNGSTTRIKGLILQDLYITRHETVVWVDLVFFSSINLFLFGLISNFLTGGTGAHAEYLLIGVVLWEMLRVCQYTVTVTSLWNMWSHNLANLFIAPISEREFVIGNILTSVIKTIAVFAGMSIAVRLGFGFDVLSINFGILVIVAASLMMFGCAVGLLLLGFVFRYGQKIQAVAWSAIYLFQPISGVFFPTSYLPRPVELISYAVPASWSIRAVHYDLDNNGPALSTALIGFGTSVAALALSAWVFHTLFHKSRVVGQFARNDL
jgi:ABC-2 type transport system permease protein